MIKEYSLLSQTLVECRIFDQYDRLAYVLRYDLKNKSIYCQAFGIWDKSSYMASSLSAFLDFMDSPHWRDAVNHSVRSRRFDLFEDLTNEVY